MTENVRENFNPNNVACKWISCESCGVKVVMTSGNGKYYQLRVYEISLYAGEIEAKNVVGKMLCESCLAALSFTPQPQYVVAD